MSATRWLTDMMELLGYFDGDEILFNEVILPPSSENTEKSESSSATPLNGETKPEGDIPEILPILPLRGLVVYPQTVVPLTIGQPRSIRLVDDVVTSEQRMIGLVASKNPELEQPNPPDLYEYGTAAIVHRLFRAPDGTIRLVVQGISRFRTSEYVQEEDWARRRATQEIHRGIKFTGVGMSLRI